MMISLIISIVNSINIDIDTNDLKITLIRLKVVYDIVDVETIINNSCNMI